MTLRADLSDTTAIVTGASSGIGQHFCTVLSNSGATVVAAARRTDRLDDLAYADDSIVAHGCDVTDPADVDAVVERAAELSGPDIVVNAAGYGDAQPALETSIDDFQKTVDVDLTGTFRMCAAAAQRMPDGGSIINIASILGLVGSWPVTQAAYCAAKGGVVNLTRQLGSEWARKGIRVNAIAPGWFPSEQTEQMFDDERSMVFINRNTPMGRPGRLDDLTGVLLFLASHGSEFVTGQTIPVDGGWTAR